eukprot:GHRR01025775.1.p1 GENE.GHRR01025775.1~~GHRR01025775.1.p1  ORF type:complete len:100 (+),score=9.62 GHRR01025775.1:1111-1410(+)
MPCGAQEQNCMGCGHVSIPGEQPPPMQNRVLTASNCSLLLEALMQRAQKRMLHRWYRHLAGRKLGLFAPFRLTTYVALSLQCPTVVARNRLLIVTVIVC